MGFLTSLFGNKETAQYSGKLRDNFKDEKYFKKEIAFFNKMLAIYNEDDEKQLKETGKLPETQYLSYCGKYRKLIETITA